MLHRGDPVETLGLTKLHIAVLRTDSNIATEDPIISVARDSIDEQDCRGRTALSWAAEIGNFDQVQRLLMKGADPNSADSIGNTPLMYCAYNDRGLTLLLEAGANVNHINRIGLSKLLTLVRDSDDVNYAETLLKWGADLNLGSSLLSPAIHGTVQRYRPHLLTWLLDHDVELEIRDRNGRTPLLRFLCCSSHHGGNPDMLEILLKKKPNLLARNDFEEGLLHFLARFSCVQYLRIFQQKSDLSELDSEQRSIRDPNSREKCDPGKTALELAEWRRDHQSEWSLASATPLDPDPQAWFAAFETFLDFVKSAHDAKLANDRGSRAEGSSSMPDSQSNTGESTSVDLQICPRLPGAFPRE